ncbi:MAG: hydrogenase maturation nickel metallochaperone HypA [Chloroflexi bacterium CG_4_10_14_0_8_um_filter_46_9]|nr:MAG: hydrogenase maturation nickel metallochaperone HypA [Chloroflexi bacterium CG08_land_8_20_14_0_20_45_12]PIX27562.1 MAG: hydrogenase maturation nickel metallochaperone HypA [Chloroflexi bacterium CG_4_8_14_3_um_filter_45_15]PIZ26784.1 MAG: hydrogenase maturation nickel metallochaperone HypA [Chloroflexi bacterium CG_4_10_14_0_8_um_filter_46_9]
MHELSITQSIVDVISKKSQEGQVSRITQVNLVIGELSGFVPDCIKFYFDFLSKDTIAEGAVLNFQLIPARLRCRDCSTIFSPQGRDWTCPECHSLSLEIIGGRELYIESMEVE